MGVGDPTQVQVYSDLHVIFNFPFTSSSNIADNIACTYTVNGFTFTRTGTSNTTALGYGTLMLPGGTYNNIMKVQLNYTYFDTSAGFPGTTTKSNAYLWFDATHKTPVLGIYYTDLIVGGFTQSTKSVVVADFAVGMEDSKGTSASFTVYPNPAQAEAAVNFELKKEQDVDIKIINVAGQLVKNIRYEKIPAGVHSEKLDVSALASGMYFITLNVGGIVSERKLIIE